MKTLLMNLTRSTNFDLAIIKLVKILCIAFILTLGFLSL